MGLEHTVYQQKLRRMVLFSLEKRCLKEDNFAIYELLMGGCREYGA